ncbi:hypothetical protein BGX26_000113, partial [Mortierella sp. AD094]
IPVSETTDAERGSGHRDSEDNNNNHRSNLAFARSQKSPVNNTSASGNKIIGGANPASSGSNGGNSSSSRGKGKDHRGYSALNHDDDDDDEFEDAGEDSVMLRPLASSSAASGSAPRRPVYPSNADDDEDDDNDNNNNEISVAMPTEGSSSSSTHNGKSTSTGAAAKNSGARTTNMSFLARLTGRQRPERDAQRMVRSAVDGVFSNLSAKPRVEKPYEEELPPAYKTAAMDVSPAYHETMLPPGFTDDDDMLLVEGLPVGGLFGFMWNMIISMTFQFVGFFLTYLLHTSHSTKQGSKTGLGITFISMGYRMMNGKLPGDEDYSDPAEDNTGYMGNTGTTPNYATGVDYDWLSYLILIMGVVIVIQSVSAFTKVKLSEIRVTLAANAAAHEAVVSSSAAAGVSSSAEPRNDGAVLVAMLS